MCGQSKRHVLVLLAIFLLTSTKKTVFALDGGAGGEVGEDDHYDDDNYDDDSYDYDDDIGGTSSVRTTATTAPKTHKVHTESPEEAAAEVVSPQKQEISDVCSHWSLQQAASYAASRYCEHLGRHHKRKYKIECSTIRFEVIRADVRMSMVIPSDTSAQHYESTVALTNSEGECVGAFNSIIHVSQGDPPELREVHTLPCTKIQVTGGCIGPDSAAKSNAAVTITKENIKQLTSPPEIAMKTVEETKITNAPSARHTKDPTKMPSEPPTRNPTNMPSISPTLEPTISPTMATKPPTTPPTSAPSGSPSEAPKGPFAPPTGAPTSAPVTTPPTGAPSKAKITPTVAKGVWLVEANKHNQGAAEKKVAKEVWNPDGNEPAGVGILNQEVEHVEDSESDDGTDDEEKEDASTFTSGDGDESSGDSVALCNRYGESLAQGRVYVCGTEAYICGDDKAWRKKFALVAEDSSVDECNLSTITNAYSSRKLCDQFPQGQSAEVNLLSESPVDCPKGGVLTHFYQFCAEKTGNYYCDVNGKDCETCTGVSRRQKHFLRH